MTHDDWLMVFKIGVLLTWLLIVCALPALIKARFWLLAAVVFVVAVAFAVGTFDSIAAGVW